MFAFFSNTHMAGCMKRFSTFPLLKRIALSRFVPKLSAVVIDDAVVCFVCLKERLGYVFNFLWGGGGVKSGVCFVFFFQKIYAMFDRLKTGYLSSVDIHEASENFNDYTFLTSAEVRLFR